LINISETFYYLCSILDGCSLNRQLGSAGVDDRADIEIILERAKEPHP
jgi:hypothetical protein